MSRYLIEERPLTVLPTLVKALGFERAVLLQQIHWLLGQPKSGVIIDDEKWVYGTYEEWCADYFMFWEPRTLRHHIGKLEEQGLLLSCQPRSKERDMTKYYRVDYDKLDELLEPSPSAQSVTSMCQRVDTSNRQRVDTSMRQDVDACYIEQKLPTETSYREIARTHSFDSSTSKTGDPNMDASVANAEKRKANSGRRTIPGWQADMNLVLPAKIRVPLAEKIAEVCGATARMNAREKDLIFFHQQAIDFHVLGEVTPEHIEALYNIWASDDWNTKRKDFPEPYDLVKISSQSKQKPASKQSSGEFLGENRDSYNHIPSGGKIMQPFEIKWKE